MFFMRRSSRLGLGMVMGSMATLAVVGAAAYCYPPSRCMAERLYKKGRRRLAAMGVLR